jgi:hypothetical protein
MRSTTLITTLLALLTSYNVNAVNLCEGAPASLADTNRPYSGYKWADANWGIEKPVSGVYGSFVVVKVWLADGEARMG